MISTSRRGVGTFKSRIPRPREGTAEADTLQAYQSMMSEQEAAEATSDKSAIEPLEADAKPGAEPAVMNDDLGSAEDDAPAIASSSTEALHNEALLSERSKTILTEMGETEVATPVAKDSSAAESNQQSWNASESLPVDGLDENGIYELALRGFDHEPRRSPASDKALRQVQVPRLDLLCVQFIAEHLNEHPIIDQLPEEYIDSVVARFNPASVSISIAAKYIMCEPFWRRMAEQWPNADVNQYGSSWKRLFFENMLQQLLEKYHASKTDFNYASLMKRVEAARPYVHSLQLRELRSHVNLSRVLKGFFNLTTLDLTFGAPNLGMNYDKAEFGMHVSDANALGVLLTNTKSLSNLSLRESLLNDELMGVLAKGLVNNQTLTSLDLSHNQLGDEAARRLSAHLEQENVLISLNLSDNSIGQDGAEHLGQALRKNTTLQELSLRLNKISDAGGALLLEALHDNFSLEVLNLSANYLSRRSGLVLLDLIRQNESLVSLDISCNNVISDRGNKLQAVLRENSTLTSLDLRENPGISEEAELSIARLLYEREVELDRSRRQKFFAEKWDEQ